jgi:hypothetical protein
MKMGTKSILFGAHQFMIHPWFVAAAWWRLYGFPTDIRLWVAFFVHDIGYWGMPNMDGFEGEMHPYLGARVMRWLFDYQLVWTHSHVTELSPLTCSPWFCFTLNHSRFLAKKHPTRHSRLCVADKLALAMTWRWLYLICTNLTGEIHEYMKGQGARTPAGERSQWEWITDVQKYVRAWAYEHRDCRTDTWTGTKRDLAIH